MGWVVLFRRQQQTVPKPVLGPWRKRRWGEILLWLPITALVVVAVIVLVRSEFYLESKGGYGKEIVGQAIVIDGDTLKIRSARIRLEGIDAPEKNQSCTVQGQEYLCGQYATRALSNKIANRSVTCKRRERDQYDRILAICYVGEENLNRWMVAQGWALAYREYSIAYVWAEREASAAKLGMWQGDFVDPWDWRRGKRH